MYFAFRYSINDNISTIKNMITTIQPRQYYPISRVLPDPADTATYYVRAFIRNAKTNALIATISLTDQGNHIFSSNYQMPADVSGQGLFIIVTTKVYSDAAYTVQDTSYGDDQDTLLIYDRMKEAQLIASQVNALVSGGSSGEDINYTKIEKILRKVVKEEMAKQETGEDTPVDLSPVMETLNEIKTIVSEDDLDDSEDTPVDFSPILDAIQRVYDAVQGISSEEEKEEGQIDLSPVVNAISDIKKILVQDTDDDKFHSLEDQINAFAKKIIEFHDLLLDIKDDTKATRPVPVIPAPRATLNKFGNVPRKLSVKNL